MPVHPVLGECVDRYLEDGEAGGRKKKDDDERHGGRGAREELLMELMRAASH